MSLSIIITYLPEHLFSIPFCLERLSAQTDTDFEVILVGADSTELQPVLDYMARQMALRHLPTDVLSLNQMRHLGAQAAENTRLLFISSLLLLNSDALAAFKRYMQAEKGLFLGLLGQYPQNVSFSQWYPNMRIYYVSHLIQVYRHTDIQVAPDVVLHPHWFFDPQYFALDKDLYFHLNGFSQDFNDTDGAYEFAYRAGKHIGHFSLVLDAWAETLVYKEVMPFSLTLEKHQFKLPSADPGLFELKPRYRQENMQSWLKQVFGYYLQHDRYILPQYKQRLLQTDAKIDLGANPHAKQFKAFYIQRRVQQKPAFFIIGAAKAGTTALFRYLAFHPGLNSALIKEPHFFDREDNFALGTEVYLDYFCFEPDSLAYEATPTYLTTPVCAQRLAAFHPEARLIILLREPVARAYSEWNMFHYPNLTLQEKGLYDPRSFETAIQDELANPNQEYTYLAKSQYLQHLERYLKFFPQDQLLILDFDTLASEPRETVYCCFEFLQIPQHDYSQIHLFPENKGQYRQPMEPETRQTLTTYFKPFNFALKKKFKLDFAWLE